MTAGTVVDAWAEADAACEVSVSADGTVRAASGACRALLGVAADALPGRRAPEVIAGLEALVAPEAHGSFEARGVATARRLACHWTRTAAGEIALLLFDAALAHGGAGLPANLAGAAAHDLRNPLASVKLNLQALAREAGGERTARRLAIALREVASLEHAIEVLAECGRAGEVGAARVAPHALAEAVRTACRPDLEPLGLGLRVEVAPGTPAALGEAGRLALALAALVRSAARAGSGEVTVAATVAEAGARWGVGRTLLHPPAGRSLAFALAERVAADVGGRFAIEPVGAGVEYALYLPAAP